MPQRANVRQQWVYFMLVLLSVWLLDMRSLLYAADVTQAVSAAAEHNVIRAALSEQSTLNNLGFGLNESYDFSQQPKPAQPLSDLQDSVVLQNSAAQHVQSCTFQHINSQYGQNLFAGTGTHWTAEHAVNSWANEARHYDYQTDSCAAGELCGHYTQQVWANTANVGCVIRQCAEMTDRFGNTMFGGRSGVLIFCHYDPPGNVVTRKPYVRAAEPILVDLTFTMTAFLQGAYQASESMMHAIPAGWSIPLTEPYSALGHTISGAATLNESLLQRSDGEALLDWVMVELRDAAEPGQILESRVALIRRDGRLVNPQNGSAALQFPDRVAGNYHLALRHRNHLGVMTRQAVSLSATAVNVDFSSPATAVWGVSARTEVAGYSLLWGGDVNHDGRIIAAGANNDLVPTQYEVLTDPGNTDFSANYIVQGYQQGDINLDNQTIAVGNANDLNIVRSNVLLHPGNETFSMNFIVQQQLP